MTDFSVEPLSDSIYEKTKNFVESNEKYSVLLSSMISAVKVPDSIAPQGNIFCIFKTENSIKTLEGVFGITHGDLLIHNVPFLFKNNQTINSETKHLLQQLLLEKLKPIVSNYEIFSIMGEEESTNLFINASGKTPECKRSYILMEYAPSTAEADFSRFSPKRFLPKELFMRICSPLDTETLYPLQKEYDIVEVLPPGKIHNELACKLGLKKNLSHHLIYAVFYGNKAVAKAGTNAMGTFYFQLGGVYTAKEWRNRHLARAAVGIVVKAALSQGKKIVLFVKTQNEPAKKAYTHAGFVPFADYEICYF